MSVTKIVDFTSDTKKPVVFLGDNFFSIAFATAVFSIEIFDKMIIVALGNF